MCDNCDHFNLCILGFVSKFVINIKLVSTKQCSNLNDEISYFEQILLLNESKLDCLSLRFKF